MTIVKKSGSWCSASLRKYCYYRISTEDYKETDYCIRALRGSQEACDLISSTPVLKLCGINC
jgi:hypothetical protein